MMKCCPYLSRVFMVVGLAVLLASAVSASWVLHEPTGGDSMARDGKTPAAAPGVVCLGYVDLERSVASLHPLQDGRVTGIPARENEPVEAGAVLVQLDDSLPRLQENEAKVALDTAKAKLEQARKLPEQHRARLDQQGASVEAAGHRLDAARALLARKQHLLKAHQLSLEEVTAAENQVQEFEAAARAEAARLRELRLTDPAVDVSRAELAVAAAQSRVDQARHAVDECALKAPEAGTVLRILVSPGDVLQGQAQKPAVLFAPKGPRLVRAEVDQEFAGRVEAGQRAVVEDDSASGIRWKGHVLRLADWYHQRRTILKEPAPPLDVRTIECLIQLDEGQELPRLGQRVRVTIGG
jgi:multidrug resistance efflux pump